VAINSLWKRYVQGISQRLGVDEPEQRGIGFWRNRLFVLVLAYTFPLSMIALIPGMWFTVMIQHWAFFTVDVLVLLLLIALVTLQGISLAWRRLLFIGIVYFVGIAMLIFIGPEGPGLLYLYAATIFSIFILPNAFAFWPSVLNLLICLAYGTLVYFGLVEWRSYSNYHVQEWAAVSSNLIFLGFISSAILPRVFSGLETALKKETELAQKLSQQQDAMEKTLEELKQKNKELELFSFAASHDLQEPLRMVSSFMSQLERKYGPQLDEKAHQYIYFARDGAQRMKKIIQDLLRYSGLENQEVALEWIDTQALVQEVLLLLQAPIKQKAAVIQLEELPPIFSAETRVKLVFQNLIENALKYSRPNHPPRIKISCSSQSSEWKFCVQDEGTGIDPAVKDEIFLLFHRLPQTEHTPGTGIGLALVQKNIERLGGRIYVESQPDAGAAFYFTIPIPVEQ